MGSVFTPTKHRRLPGTILALAAIAAVIAAMGAGTASAAGPAYVIGDVFAAVGQGQVKQFSNTGTLLNTLTGQPSVFTAGMAFDATDASANLYATGFDGAVVSKFDNMGTLLGSFGSGYNADPESIVLDAAGNFYVGQADGTRDVLKFDSTGTQVDSFDVATERRGSDWIDLAADQCTLFYTSEGVLVKRYDVCTHTQLADFATLPTGEAYALRIRPNGDIMVAATSQVHRLDSTGAVLQSYTLPGTSLLFALNLDPDGTSFWTGDLFTGEIFRIDIATGAIITQFNSTPNNVMGGLAIFGEITAAIPPIPCPAGKFTSKVDPVTGDLSIVFDQFPAPNDNSYGANAVGWGTKGHTFGNLVGSDHAGFQLVDPSGVTRLDFNIDYISSKTGTPSGYGSLGPFGGDGKVNVGTLLPADLTFDTSEARNLNNNGFCSAPLACTFAGTNLLVDSPKTGNTVDNYTVVDPALAAWDFHDTYFVTIKAAKLAALGFNAATWKVQPNPDALHNSPAKPCPCPTDMPSTDPTVTVTDNGDGTSTVRYEQSLAVNDNSYGANAVGWGSKGHTFDNLRGSDRLEFRFTNGAGGVTVDFFMDYISAKSGAPSGYGSLGASGGDGSCVTRSCTSAIVSFTTSLDRNLNTLGFFLTEDSPPTVSNTDYTLLPLSPYTGWEFKNIYEVTVKNTVFGGAAPSVDRVSFPLVHNSPAKPNLCPGADACNLSVVKTEVRGRQVKIEIRNNGTADAFLTALNATWPQATNGNLKKVTLGRDTIYDKPDLGGGTASLTFAGGRKSKIGKGKSETLVLEFASKADANLAAYTATAMFANCPDPLKLLGP